MTFRLRLALSVASLLAVSMAGFGGAQLAASRAREDAAIDRELLVRLQPFIRQNSIGQGPNGPPQFGPGQGQGQGMGPGLRQMQGQGRGPGGQGGPIGQGGQGGPGRQPQNPNSGLTDIEFWERPIRLGPNGMLPEFDSGRPIPDRQALSLRRRVIRTVAFSGQNVRVLTHPMPIGAVQTIVPLAEVESRRQRELLLFIVLLPIGFALAAFAGWWLAGRAIRPIERLREAAVGTTANTLGRKIPEDGDEEFAELAAAFNRMLGRLDSSFERQRQFTADAAHELRTPLTRLGVAVGSALDDPAADEARLRRALGIAQDAGTAMTRLVNDLLLLAQADRGVFTEGFESFDLRSLVLDWQAEGLRVTVPDSPVVIVGRRELIARAISNYVENARKYSPGDVRIGVTVDGREARVSVSDNGPGISEADRARVFDRFTRLDKDRSRESGGFGLGLAIAKGVAEAHGGKVGVDVQNGSTFWISVPISNIGNPHSFQIGDS